MEDDFSCLPVFRDLHPAGGAAELRGIVENGPGAVLGGKQQAVFHLARQDILPLHAGVQRAFCSPDVPDRAEQELQQLHRVNAAGQQRPAAGSRVKHPAVVGGWEAVAQLRHIHLTQLAGIDAAFDFQNCRQKQHFLCFHQKHPFFPGLCKELPGLVRRGGHGFFADDMLSRFQRRHCPLEMQGIDGGNIDDIHIRITQQRLMAAVGPGNIPKGRFFPCFFLRPGRKRQNFTALP